MKKRVVSAIVALLITVPLVYLGGFPFHLLVFIIATLGYREIIKLFTDDFWTELLSYLCFSTIILSNINQTSFDALLDYRIIGIIFLIFTMLALYNHKKKDINKYFSLLGITIFSGVSFSVMIIIRNMSLSYFIYLFLISIATDVFAHSIGTLLGKHKINEISPNKTWEGSLGGTFFGVLVGTLFYLILINGDTNILFICIITLFLSIIGQLGDLFFSLIKRNYNIKDFSNIMPGHGGVLDRLDSIIFIMLAFTYFITFL